MPTEPVPRSGQSARYTELIRGALEAIPNVNNIDIDGGEDIGLLGAPLQERWPSLDAPFFALYPLWLNIAFDLYVPARIQEQILSPVSEGF